MLSDKANVSVSEVDQTWHNVRFGSCGGPIQRRSKAFKSLQGKSIQQKLFGGKVSARRIVADSELTGKLT